MAKNRRLSVIWATFGEFPENAPPRVDCGHEFTPAPPTGQALRWYSSPQGLIPAVTCFCRPCFQRSRPARGGVDAPAPSGHLGEVFQAVAFDKRLFFVQIPARSTIFLILKSAFFR